MTTRAAAILISGVLVLAGCGDDGGDTGSTTTERTTTTSAPSTTTTTVPAPDAQPAIWPGPEVVFTTPEEAAADFVANALGVPPELGDFRAGDARSGEIEVLSLGEGGAADPPLVRSTLLLRQLGPDDGWFVIGAVSDNATITSPQERAEVPAGALTVEGAARGFEGTVLVSAFPAGDAAAELDLAIATGGALADPEPYSASVDLTGAGAGTVVTVLVRGGTGLDTDPGDFSAVPVVIAP